MRQAMEQSWEGAGMSRCARKRQRVGAALLPVVVVLCAVFCAVAVNLGRPMDVSASGNTGMLNFTPESGPAEKVGVQVYIVRPQAAQGQPPTTYTLYVTMSDPATFPDQGNCPASAIQRVPGVAPFAIGDGGGNTVFTWPAALNQGPYWFCANAANPAYGVRSTDRFTVLPDVPTPTGKTQASSVVASVPAQGISAGATFTLTVTGWTSPYGTPPQWVFLAVVPSEVSVSSDGFDTSGDPRAPFTITPGNSSGTYVLTVTVPETAPGPYWVVVADKGGWVTSTSSFRVILAPTPTIAPARAAIDPGRTTSSTGASPSLLVVALLLAVAMLMLASVLVRRRLRRQRARAALQLRERQPHPSRDPRYP